MNSCASQIADIAIIRKLISNTLEENPRYNHLKALHHVLKHPFESSIKAKVEVTPNNSILKLVLLHPLEALAKRRVACLLPLLGLALQLPLHTLPLADLAVD